MIDVTPAGQHIQCVTSFQSLVATPFQGDINALCWKRNLQGDFAELVHKISLYDTMAELDPAQLHALELSPQGQLAREVLLQDLKMLTAQGASPTLNLIQRYERDDAYPFFPTDVYSFHVDRSHVPTDTYLCTYYGAASELIPNAQVDQKVLLPEIREALKKLYGGAEKGFESFLTEHFFDLHYQPKPNAHSISLGLGNIWKLAVDHPQSNVLPCVHRAPKEKPGETRLLLIC